jgi:hypothetical protein
MAQQEIPIMTKQITAEQDREAANYLRKAAEVLQSETAYTAIELLAAFNRGIATITDPVSMHKQNRI